MGTHNNQRALVSTTNIHYLLRTSLLCRTLYQPMFVLTHQERDVKMRKLGGFPKCHFFNTFFINKLYK